MEETGWCEFGQAQSLGILWELKHWTLQIYLIIQRKNGRPKRHRKSRLAQIRPGSVAMDAMGNKALYSPDLSNQ